MTIQLVRQLESACNGLSLSAYCPLLLARLWLQAS
jgi:hypothetical protein